MQLADGQDSHALGASATALIMNWEGGCLDCGVVAQSTALRYDKEFRPPPAEPAERSGHYVQSEHARH